MKDPRATVAQRLEACKLLARGYIPHDPSHRNRTKGEMAAEAVSGPDRPPASSANINRLKELAGKIALGKSVTDRPPVGLPETCNEAAHRSGRLGTTFEAIWPVPGSLRAALLLRGPGQRIVAVDDLMLQERSAIEEILAEIAWSFWQLTDEFPA